MGKRGPVPTPTRILENRGSWRGKVRNEEEPEALGNLRIPHWLQGAGRKMWQRISPELKALGLVGTVDSHMLARYCALFARWLECNEFINEKGMVETVSTKDSEYVKEYPQVARLVSLNQQLVQMERNFGMSPAARVSLVPQKSSKKEVNDDKNRFFKVG